MGWFKSKTKSKPETETKKRIVATIGKSTGGKTTFLTSLFWDSFFTLPKTLPGYSVAARSNEALNVFYDNGEILHDKRLPGFTLTAVPKSAPLEFTLPGLRPQSQQSITLTFYDVAGEGFTDEQSVREYAPFLAQADDLIFLFDPTDPQFNAFAAGRLVDLVNLVAQDGGQKHILIVLTKIDELIRTDKQWARTCQLWPDVPPGRADLRAYCWQMDQFSNSLRNWWTDPARKAQGFINKLPEATTHYCALSALGHHPVWDCPRCFTVNHSKRLSCDKCALRLSGPVWDCLACSTANPNTDNPKQKCSNCEQERVKVVPHLTKEPEPFRVRDPLFWIFREAGVI